MSHTQLFSILAVLLSCPALAAQRGEAPPVIRVEAPQEEATASTVQDPGKDQTPGTSIFQPGGPSQPGTQPFPF
ncbi:MAG: hypothetical protein MK213_09180, partial [Planctomycetes bacterium]|nr:hypothetical protein [Planctomycetota bacterium]